MCRLSFYGSTFFHLISVLSAPLPTPSQIKTELARKIVALLGVTPLLRAACDKKKINFPHLISLNSAIFPTSFRLQKQMISPQRPLTAEAVLDTAAIRKIVLLAYSGSKCLTEMQKNILKNIHLHDKLLNLQLSKPDIITIFKLWRFRGQPSHTIYTITRMIFYQ